MKKSIILTSVVALIMCSVMYVVFKREFDEFNPFYKKEIVYAVITKPTKYEEKLDRYRYNLSGYTEKGDKKAVTFASSTEFEQGTYVAVKAKGAYTYSWTVIKQEEIPKGALK